VISLGEDGAKEKNTVRKQETGKKIREIESFYFLAF
jgi:hypothetical protein